MENDDKTLFESSDNEGTFENLDARDGEQNENADTNATDDGSHAMTEEEIRAAAENIGPSPYPSYEWNTSAASNTGNGYTYSQDRVIQKKKKQGFSKVAKFIGLAACFGVIAGAAFYGVNVLMENTLSNTLVKNAGLEKVDNASEAVINTLGVNNLVIAATETTDPKNVVQEDGHWNRVVDVVRNNISSSVCVNAEYIQTSLDLWSGRRNSYTVAGGGSGFIVGMNDKEVFIATNNHVVDKAESIKIAFCDDNEVAATVRATDANNDLAVVSVLKEDIGEETLAKISVAKLGNSDSAEVGEMVVAIGNALGYGESVTVGYLSAKDREVTYEDCTLTLLQTDAAINEGNSGGPLFDINGEVIGINCAKYTSEKVEGMCFAIPISAAMPILDDLMNREIVAEEDQGYLGINILAVTKDMSDLYGMPVGIYVNGVIEGYAAEKYGIYEGDIITKINDRKVKTNDELKAAVSSYKYGTSINVTVMRNVSGKWKEIEIPLVLSKKPTE